MVVPVSYRGGLGRGADEDDAAAGAGNGALDEQQALLGVDGVDGEVLGGLTRSPPIRPAIRMPLKTRPGVEQAPIEPGLRWLLCAPWDEETPWKPWRFMTPAKPLPLVVPHDVDELAGLEHVDGDLLAERVVAGVRGAELDEVAARGDAGLLEVALHAAC